MSGKAGAEAPFGAVFGPGTLYQGDMSFEGRVRVDGTYRGRLYTEGTLEIGPDGLVDGEIDVASAIVSGTLKGQVRVRESITVHPTGLIEGLLDAGLAEIHSGARLFGQVRVHGQELP